MKLIKPLLCLLIVISIMSCKSDDDGGDDTQNEPTNYFPLNANSTWNYDIETDGQPTQEDSLFVAGTQELNGFTYTNIDSVEPPFGFVTNIISDNLVRTTDTQLLIDGTIGAPIDGFPDIMIELNDFVMYDTAATPGETLSVISGMIAQEINGIPLEFEYEFKTEKLSNTNSLSFNGFEFTDVLNTSFTLTLEVTAQIQIGGVTLPIPILTEQEVLTGVGSFANDVGYVIGDSTLDYMLEDLSGLGIDLPFPSEATTVTLETMTAYTIED